jgi:hypothetical protein
MAQLRRARVQSRQVFESEVGRGRAILGGGSANEGQGSGKRRGKLLSDYESEKWNQCIKSDVIRQISAFALSAGRPLPERPICDCALSSQYGSANTIAFEARERALEFDRLAPLPGSI